MKSLVLLLVACGSLFAERIDIVYHIAMMNNWDEIVGEQLQTLAGSGLGEVCDTMTVTVVGPRKFFPIIERLFEGLKFRNKISIIYSGRDLALFEFPAIEVIQRIAKEKPNTRILYMHNKGVSHYRKATQETARLWRRYMEYFAIERWEDCLKALEEVNMCGVDLTLSADTHRKFFAGNIWWARASYVSTCQLGHKSRFDCENFIGTGNSPTARSFHQSGANPKLSWVNYEAYPEYFCYDPKVPFHRGILNLYSFPYLEEYYKQ